MTGSPINQKRLPIPPLPPLDRGESLSLGLAEVVALGLSLLWVVVFMLGDLLFGASDAALWSDPILSLLVLIVPVLLVWGCALSLRTARISAQETARISEIVEALQASVLNQTQHAVTVTEPSVAQKLEEIAETARKTETALATFQSSRTDPSRVAIPTRNPELPVEDQGALALGTSAEDMHPPLPVDQFIRALNFPETAEDEAGFTALRLALQDRRASQVIQAAQDVLTLLSQDGIYMDDLHPDMARPEVWRQFAKGARGREVAALGGVRDRTSLALSAARMKQDPIFRDAAHHFLRRFDQMFVDFEGSATDSEVAAISETRTARAFMLLGRVAGTFD